MATPLAKNARRTNGGVNLININNFYHPRLSCRILALIVLRQGGGTNFGKITDFHTFLACNSLYAARKKGAGQTGEELKRICPVVFGGVDLVQICCFDV